VRSSRHFRLDCLTLKMRAEWSSETSGTRHPITFGPIPECLNLLRCVCEEKEVVLVCHYKCCSLEICHNTDSHVVGFYTLQSSNVLTLCRNVLPLS
jgi:hypothetical protein